MADLRRTRAEAEDERTLVTDAAFETGATFFDSSPMYGEAERVLGRDAAAAVATAPSSRRRSGAPNDGEAEQQIDRVARHSSAGASTSTRCTTWSRGALRLDQLQRLKDEGAVRVIGVTHYARARSDDLLHAMKDPRVQAVQVPYNPRERWIESNDSSGGGRPGTRRDRHAAVRRRRRCCVRASPAAALEPLEAVRHHARGRRRCSSGFSAIRDVTSRFRRPHRRSTCSANAAAGEPPWFGPDERAYISQAGRASFVNERDRRERSRHVHEMVRP